MGDLAPIPLQRELRLSASPADLWPLVSNTDRFNRAIGLPAVTVAPSEPGSYTRKVATRLFGLTLSWREPPFEWVEGRFFKIVREFETGPIALFEGKIQLLPDGAGTLAKIDYTFTPKNALGTLIVRHATGKNALRDATRMIQRFDASLKGDGEAFPPRRTRALPNAEPLAQKAQALRAAKADPLLVGKLLRFIERAYDDELAGIRPFELADRWGADRLDTLRLCLQATKAGLLDMSWEVLCPNCAGVSAKPGTLSELRGSAHCNGCDVEYGVNFDQSVELRFAVSPTIRNWERHTFCVGSPSRVPFAVAQLIARPGQARELEVELGAESFVLRQLEGKRRLILRPDPSGPSELSLSLDALEGERRFKPGAVRLKLEPGAAAGVLRLERESWRDKGAPASLVTSLQDFRDLFSSEVLAPGVEIGVRTLALLFTDLKDSTALYERVGDAAAYSIVRDHFDYLFDIIKKHDGAVIKTIGDAVMAAFFRPDDAVAAALEMQRRVGELNGKLAPREPVVLKIGVHAGPLIAINTDGLLDYFGTTVNVAARVQNESKGGDIMMCESLFGDLKIAELVTGHEPMKVRLKGLSDEYALRRVRP